jgi:hypothetical protein
MARVYAYLLPLFYGSGVLASWLACFADAGRQVKGGDLLAGFFWPFAWPVILAYSVFLKLKGA